MTNAAAKKTTTRTRKPSGRLAGTMPLTGPHAGEFIPAKKVTAKKTTAKKAPAKKATAAKKAAAPASDKPKKEQTFEERDWTYLDDKDPSEQHVILAKEINRRTNLEVTCDGCEEVVEISPKQVQAVLAMFPHFQRSATNKARSGYHALAAEIVEKRSEHMTLAHKEAREIMDGLAQETVKKTTKKAPAKKTTTPAKKATTAQPAAAKKVAAKTPARKARVTKRTPAIPAPATNEAF